MKKLLMIILCLILAANLCSCETSEGTPSQVAPFGIKLQEVASAANKNDGGVHAYGEGQWDMRGAKEGRTIPQELTITFDGKTYTGKYVDTYGYTYDTYNIDRYLVEADRISFDVDASDGSLETIMFPDRPEGDKTIEDCKTEALRIAKQYINTDLYELRTNTNDSLHTFFFRRKIGEYDTVAAMSIGIDKQGNCAYINRMMTDEFEEWISKQDESEIKATLAKFDADITHSAIEEKVRSIYATMEKWEITNKLVVVTPDDKVGMVYTVLAYLAGEEYHEGEGSYGTQILVTLE